MTTLGSIDADVGEINESLIDKEFLEVEHVRIYPGILTFNGAYDGKEFLEKFRIINCGKVPVFVRVMEPTSKAFKMKPLPKGCILSSGLSITRYIRYTHSCATAIPQVYITLYINENPVLYELKVYISQSIVKATPKRLDFGDINIGTSSEQLSISLQNDGQKVSHFTVDLGRNDLELIVEPMKGSIQPYKTVEIKVEILGSKEGIFLKEIWIKTEPPQRIWLTGTFIIPRLKIEHPTSTFDLIVIDFPKTYYNADSVRALVIKNSSSTNTMFCTMACYNNEEKKLEEVTKLDNNLKFFLFNPKEGRLVKKSKTIIIVTFAPRRLRTFTQKYCIAMVKIIQVNYRDGVIKGQDVEVKTFSSKLEADQFKIGSMCSIDEDFTEYEFTSSYLRLCLYGEIEEPDVRLTPHSFDRDDLNAGQMYKFTFNIKNFSKYLPITINYEKLACFEIIPSEMILQPNCSIDVLLLLKPTIGKVDTNINFGLTYKAYGRVYNVGNVHFHVRYVCHLHPEQVSPMTRPKFNMGITPAITNEVGFLVDNTRFNEAKNAPVMAFVDNMKRMGFSEKNTNIIAFPNDRPRSLRPWTTKEPCLTIFTNTPRATTAVDDYALTQLEMVKKMQNKQTYIDLLRKNRKPTKEYENGSSDSNLYPTIPEKVLMTNEVIKDCPYVFTSLQKHQGVTPLTPEQLRGIEISPHYIQLGKIAPYISCSDFFTIKNKNDFSVRIDIVALSNCVVVKGKKITKISASATTKVYFDCYSHGLGKYYVPVYIIINYCHIFDATVFADVVTTTVKCKSKEVVTNPKDNVAYLELHNPVNCAIDFYWSVLDKNYSVKPSNGIIESRRSLYCKIVFTPSIEAVFKTDLLLYSQSGAKQVIYLSTSNQRASVLFNTRILEFNDIPLNMTVVEYLAFRNKSPSTVVIYIKDENPMSEITVTPKQAIVPGRSVVFFKVFAHFRTVEQFKCECIFVVQDVYSYNIEIIGNVIYPTFSVEPNHIQIAKIVTGARQRKVFRIRNTSKAKISIKFALDLYPDYHVLNMDKRVMEQIDLQPREAIGLYLNFEPPEPTAYTFYVPMVVNDLVGPALLNNPSSFQYATYFDRPPTTEDSAQHIMAGLRVTCAAGSPWFRFSSFNLNFNNSTLTNSFSISNISTLTRILKLFTDKLDDCFSIEVQEFEGIVRIKESYIKVTLEPEQTIEFTFNFYNGYYGEHESEVPIFVDTFFENCPFNCVKLYADARRPTIESKIKMLCLPTIPSDEVCMSIVPFTVHSHLPDCTITVTTEDEFLHAKLEDADNESSNNTIQILFSPKTQCNIVSKLIISCSCEASYEIAVVASANNCSLLSFRHQMKWYTDKKEEEKKESLEDYNFDKDNDLFREKLEKMKNILEQYVYTQGFFSSMFYRIPETIRKYPFEAYRVTQKKKNFKKERKIHLPIVVLLKNMVDSQIIKLLADGVHYAALDDVEGTSYDYGIYKNVLLYLEEYCMFSRNIKPEHLLSYKRYLVLKERCVDEENIIDDILLPQEEYDFISKYSWVDLLLRIFKFFTYDRLLLEEPPVTGRLVIQDPFEEQSRDYYLANKHNFGTEIDEGEVKLMLWLEYHFNNKKDILWPDKMMSNREIRDLSVDVRDSLPLITLTATYCPYLEEYFRGTYFEPFTDPGQLLHNACLVSEAWNKLGLSFTISTDNIVEPTNIEMIIFLTYLYSVLPCFYPTESVTIKSNLGESSSVHILLTNNTHAISNYKAILFLNNNESFYLKQDEITIEPKKKQDLRVFYKAKQVFKEEAVLVLSGEFGTDKYSKSSAINLIGIPDILYSVDEFTVKVSMYQLIRKTISIQSPYSENYSANTYLYLYDPNNPPMTMNEFVSVSALPDLPRQLGIDGVCDFNEKGYHKLVINLCFVTRGTAIYYVYFVNKEVGTFCIKLTIESKLPRDAFEEIRIRIPSNFDTLSMCKCKDTIKPACPRTLKINLPFRNTHLLNGLRKMIGIHAGTDEQEFWDLHLVFPRGFHIFREYLKNSFEPRLTPFIRVLDQEVTYTPRVEGGRCSVEGKIKIKDTTDEGTFQLLLHWDVTSFPKKETVILKADHMMEFRKFHLTFWTKEPRPMI